MENEMTMDTGLLSLYAGLGMAKQGALGQFLGEHGWALDLDQGLVDFGEGRQYRIDLLGTESHSSGSWLWAWANGNLDLPEEVGAASRRLRDFGAQQGHAVFAEGHFGLDAVTGYEIALVSMGLEGADACYRGSYEGGAVYFLIRGLPEEARPVPSPQGAVSALTAAISSFEVDHRLLVESFLEQLGGRREEFEDRIEAVLGSGRLRVVFDGQGRIATVEAGRP